MEHIQNKNSEFNQYWFYVPVPEFNIYPKSEGCNLGAAVKMNKRMVGLTTPKKLDPNKKYKYIVNTDFNIDGQASDWWCGGSSMISGLGGLIDRACYDDPNYLMKNVMETMRQLIRKDYIIIHLSMMAEDVYLNQPCDSTNVCKKCWTENNPDQQYLESLFDKIYANDFPAPLKGNLSIDYNMLTLFGYSVGAGAVSRYFNDFPSMRTTSGHPLPAIKTGVMIAGGSLYCFSKDCKDSYCDGDKNFSPCYNPNLKVRGCCPHNLSEPNFDNGVIPWSKHPSVLIIQSIDDSYSDPMAGTYYYDVMKEHSVPAKKVMAESTVHGITTEHQANEIVSWIEKYNENKPGIISSPVLIIIVGLILFTLFLLVFSGANKNTFLIIMIMVVTTLTALIISQPTKSKDSSNGSENVLQKAIDQINSSDRLTAGELFDKVVAIRDNIYSNQPDLGGILVHLLPLEGLEAINAQKEFSFSLGLSNLPVKDRDGVICDCSVVGQNKQNCSAWTYLRKDLPPIVYSYPSSGYGPSSMRFWTPSVGLIINPSEAWPIITTMGVVDSATDARNCGSQDSGYVFNIFDPKNDAGRCVVSVNGDQSYCVYQSLDTSVGCDSNCEYNDNIESLNCRMRNAGGSVNSNSWFTNEGALYGWDCPSESEWKLADYPEGMPGCYQAQAIEWENISPVDQKALMAAGYGKGSGCKKWGKWIPGPKCYMTNPTIYKEQDTNQGGQVGNMIDQTNLEVPALLPGTNISNEGRNYFYVGKNVNQNVGGATFSEQTWKNCSEKSGPVAVGCKISDTTANPNHIPISTWYTITKQAKWIKQDWGRWVEEIKKMWSYIYSTLSPETGYKNLTAKLDGDGVACDNGNCNYNWVYGNPCNAGDWWENEVNIYVNANMAANPDSDLNILFRKSMLGAFYIGKTCEDFASDLPSGTTGPTNCVFANKEERCAGYLCSVKDINKKDIGSTKCDGGKTYEQVKNEELARMERGKEEVVKFVEKFNKKYRKNDKNIIGYKLMTASNAFSSEKALQKVFSGEQTSTDVLIPIE